MRSLADSAHRFPLRKLRTAPHGFKDHHMLVQLILHDIRLVRATWFIKVVFLNQVGPSFAPSRILSAKKRGR